MATTSVLTEALASLGIPSAPTDEQVLKPAETAHAHSPLCGIGLSHHSAPVSLRSKAALSQDQTKELLHLSKARARECVVLSTCNRTEIYFSGTGPEAIVELLSEYCEFELDEIEPHLYVRHCSQAAAHLFKVSSGLDSAVLGETEIVAQIKSAWRLAEEVGTTGPLVDLLLRRSLEAGKRVRTETDLCRNVTSTGSLAVKMICDRFGSLAGRSIVLIGAGKIARRVGRELQTSGADGVTIISRTFERAADLAGETGATAAPMFELPTALTDADAVIAAVNVSEPLISAAELRLLQASRLDRPLMIIDMGVPRNVEVCNSPGITNIDIDQLTAECESNTERRMATIPAANEILAAELVRFNEALTVQAAAPTIRALMERAEAIRVRNLDWARERLPHLSDGELRVVEDMARRMMKGMLQTPIQNLKGDVSEQHREVIARIFGLTEGNGDAA